MSDRPFFDLLEEALRSEPGSIHATDRLRDLQGWDSMSALAAVALIDERYGITLDEEALVACETVGQLAALVEKR